MLRTISFLFSDSAFLINKVILISLGYQKKGWTDGEIGAEWIKIFDAQTCNKAGNDEYRLLIVDGHNSHYTAAFLEYAREHKIIVICYPAHATHIYQGLDVVVFSPFKTHLSNERDNLLRDTGLPISKDNFLQVLSKVWIKAFTPEIIKTAFRKTGIHPFDPTVIKPHQLAPSKETSCAAHLPIPLPTASANDVTSIIADMLRKLQLAETQGSDKDSTSPGPHSRDPDPLSPPTRHDGETAITRNNLNEVPVAGPSEVRVTRSASRSTNQSNSAVQLEPSVSPLTPPSSEPHTDAEIAIIIDTIEKLRKSDHNFLVSAVPPKSTDPSPSLPLLNQSDMSEIVHSIGDALEIKPRTENELLLLSALRQSEQLRTVFERHSFQLQAAHIANEAYTDRFKRQLAAQEDKKKKGKGALKLNGDGLPRLLTGDEFYARVQERQKEIQREEKAKVDRNAARQRYQIANEEWKKASAIWRQEYDAAREYNRNGQAAYKTKAAAAKKAKKPLKKSDKFVPKPVPKKPTAPRLKDFLESSQSDDEEDLQLDGSEEDDEPTSSNDDDDDDE